ncbi:MAG TPA: L-histidine N(alpha)-methyltransferase [Bryobacteraceae bacterium]|nr:L-histidine N(alpha)-methyltransferase [Bryobacteraceae bacterium]
MKVEVVLTEADMAQEFAEAVEARDLPEKFFFWSPQSAAEWSKLSRDPDLYGGLGETWSQLAAECTTLAADFPGIVPVISFGAGDGSRDRLWMEALKETGRESAYFPTDSSQAMLELACAGADDEDIQTVGIKADISSPVHLVFAADAAEPPRLYIISGNTLGAFDPLAEIRYIAQCMKAGDRLIIDGELYDEQKTMERRDNPSSRRFLSALLSGVGIGNDHGEIRFEQRRDDRHAGLHVITRHFRAAQDLSATISGESISLQRGERVGLNFQYTYTPNAFHWLLTEQGGLEIMKEYESPDGRFLTAICRK